MIKYIKEYEKRSIISSIIMILTASLLIVRPEAILNTIITIFSIAIFLDGVFAIIFYIFTDKEQRMFGTELAEGIIEVIAAVLMLINKSFMISVIPVIVGIWIGIKSIMKLQISFNMKNANEKGWIFLVISSIVTLLIGIIIVINPFDTMVTITVLAGILLLITGIIDLTESICILIKLQ